MNKKVPLILLIGFLVTSISAQRTNQQFDYEKFKSQKIAFITEKLNLTPKEAQEFWPVYNEFEKQRMTWQKNRRSLEEKTRDENIKMSDQEIVKTNVFYRFCHPRKFSFSIVRRDSSGPICLNNTGSNGKIKFISKSCQLPGSLSLL